MDQVRTHRKALVARVRRIAGQVAAIERHLLADDDCGDTLVTIAACRGALTALMAEVVDDHVRHRVLGPSSGAAQRAAADELLAVVRSYLR